MSNEWKRKRAERKLKELEETKEMVKATAVLISFTFVFIVLWWCL